MMTILVQKLMAMMISVILIFSGFSDRGINYRDYSRANIEKIISQPDFGYGTSDYLYVGVDYFYKDEEIRKLYGSTFNLTSADVADVGIEYGPRLFGVYSGDGDCSIVIAGRKYVVRSHKDTFGKWKGVAIESWKY